MRKRVAMPADFDEVQLTAEEVEDLVYEERCRRYFIKKDEEKKQAEIQKIEMLRKPWRPDSLAKFVLDNNPKFKVDEQAKPVFELLTWYFTKDPRFLQANENYSFEKGLAIHGVPGCGKTELLRLFEVNKVQSFHMLSIDDIYHQCDEKDKGEKVQYANTFCGAVPGWGYQERFFYQPVIGWAIDEVGKEELFYDVGNKAYLFSKIIQARYNSKEKVPFNLLHITSMLTPEQIGEKYGNFIRSRFREMFNYIFYAGEDRRK